MKLPVEFNRQFSFKIMDTTDQEMVHKSTCTLHCVNNLDEAIQALDLLDKYPVAHGRQGKHHYQRLF